MECLTIPRLVRVKKGSMVKVDWVSKMDRQICEEMEKEYEEMSFLDNSFVFTVEEMFDKLA